MIRWLKELLVVVTWSSRPTTISKPLRGKRYRKGKFVRRVWVDRSASRPGSGDIYIGLGAIDTSIIENRTEFVFIPVARLRHSQVMTQDAAAWLVDALGLPSAEDVQASGVQGASYRLDLAITELLPGHLTWFMESVPEWLGWPLFALAIFSGHDWVQIEGILSDARTDRPVLQFVHRRRRSNLPWQVVGPGWLDPGARRIEQMIYQMAIEILKELHWRLRGKA